MNEDNLASKFKLIFIKMDPFSSQSEQKLVPADRISSSFSHYLMTSVAFKHASDGFIHDVMLHQAKLPHQVTNHVGDMSTETSCINTSVSKHRLLLVSIKCQSTSR